MSPDRLAEIEWRLETLEDRAAIMQLTARYAFAVNQGWEGVTVDAAALPAIFAPDAAWESRAMDVHATGVSAIIAGVEQGTRATNFAMHSYTNPVIAIDGDKAQANWLLFLASRRHSGPPNMVYMEDVIGYLRTGEG